MVSTDGKKETSKKEEREAEESKPAKEEPDWLKAYREEAIEAQIREGIPCPNGKMPIRKNPKDTPKYQKALEGFSQEKLNVRLAKCYYRRGMCHVGKPDGVTEDLASGLKDLKMGKKLDPKSAEIAQQCLRYKKTLEKQNEKERGSWGALFAGFSQSESGLMNPNWGKSKKKGKKGQDGPTIEEIIEMKLDDDEKPKEGDGPNKEGDGPKAVGKNPVPPVKKNGDTNSKAKKDPKNPSKKAPKPLYEDLDKDFHLMDADVKKRKEELDRAKEVMFDDFKKKYMTNRLEGGEMRNGIWFDKDGAPFV